MARTRDGPDHDDSASSSGGSPYLVHLLLSLSTLAYLLTLHSFILSPVSVITFVVRTVLQIQYSTPRRSHPDRSLRFFFVVWLVSNVAVVAIDYVYGARGTKPLNGGWTQKGIVLDFVGQLITPSNWHMILLDLLIALCQFLTLVVSFAITLPSDLDASTSTSTTDDPSSLSSSAPNDPTVTGQSAPAEAARDYFGLLGLDPSYDDDDDDDYLDLGDGTAVDGDDDDDQYKPYDPVPLTRIDSGTVKQERIPFEPIAKLRWRHVWNEIKLSTTQHRQHEYDRIVRDTEEGRTSARTNV
ncbi:uncharacterized protein JCM15063_001333 [Sporobolomyces koalae]|uniref:uncharacterized protein n=1 Tax=Sporobolomyces koalae TaxID=500713 RepID=UPI0031781FE7